jgi:aryl-alcohol dehydrogenase-like predicted oxidoreductase
VTPLSARRLGAGGPQVSALGVGCNNFGWRLDLTRSRAVIESALDSGITLFDTADTYGETASESALGATLGTRRDDVVLLTKFGYPVPDAPRLAPGSAAYIRWALAGSLRRLATDYIDVYMYHAFDGVTPWEETLDALAQAHSTGAIRSVGVSGLTAPELQKVHAACVERDLPLVAAESRYSIARRHVERDVLPACVELGVGLLPFYPLEGGLLTGKYRRGTTPSADSRFGQDSAIWPTDKWLTESSFDRVEALERFADGEGISLLQLAIGALIAQPGVGSVIAGASTPGQVRANVDAAQWQPTQDQLTRLAQSTL